MRPLYCVVCLGLLLPTVWVWAQQARQPLPDQAAQAQAHRMLKEAFAAEFRRTTPEGRKALAAELLRQVREEENDAAARYVMLREARDLAAAAGDYDAAMDAVDLAAESFQVDAPAMKLEALTKTARTPQDPDEAATLVRALLKVAEESMGGGDLQEPARIIGLAEPLLRRAENEELAAEVQRRKRELRDLQAEYKRLPQVMITLKKDPGDPAANLTLGKYLSLVLGDWERGLRHLAQGSDAVLRAIALRDVQSQIAAQRPGADDMAALADEWWTLGEKERGRSQSQLRARAGYWYERALPDLEGLKRTLAEKRLEALDPPVGDPKGAPAGANVVAGRGNGQGKRGDRLLDAIARKLPAKARPGENKNWDAYEANEWLRANLPRTPVDMEVKFLSLQKIPRGDNPNAKISAFVAFESPKRVESDGTTYSIRFNTRVDGERAVEHAAKMTQGQPGRLTGTIRGCWVSSWGKTPAGIVGSVDFMAELEGAKFTPDRAEPPPQGVVQ